MSGETEQEPSGWTVDTLARHFAVRLAALDRHTATELANSKDAVTTARVAIEKRLDLLNEFRAQSVEAAKAYPSREVVDAQIGSVERRIGVAETAIATLQGRAVAFSAIGAIIGAVVALVGGLVL